MKIPQRLEAKLAQDRSLHGATLEAVERFTAWISNSKLVFFPAYTAHGLGHFEDVLATASDVISEPAFAIVTPIDVSIIIHAVMLHDCGMHLSEDGFLTLVQDDQLVDRGGFFGDVVWPQLWTKFLEESRRFSGRTLRNIFGDEQPVSPVPSDPRDWTERHRMLIGEFIRRNHPRLAHDVAIRGIPGHSGYLQLLSPSAGLSFMDMAGVVARSHGLDLRPCLDYVSKHYDLRDYTGSHLIFDMVVLRIADYLQIQSNRAPRQYSDVKRIRSPLSANEWKVHQSVANIHQTHDDPEAIYVQATPADTSVYLRLRAWLSDLQGELDKSWAVIGEVYGRFRDQGLDRLGIKIRRVRTNLDDTDTFGDSVDYIPGEFRLTVDNVEVMGLLVGPLYDGNVMCGIRELVQNAVDAVREMDELIRSGTVVADNERVQLLGDVEVDISETVTGGHLTVRDRGLGMPLHVLTSYFLRAGASYRRSEEWRRHFETAPGAAKVLRSGRFGIGVLAAFLLGETVTVRSRSVLDRTEPGYELTASLGDDIIEIRKLDIPIGTQLTIPLSAIAKAAIVSLFKSKRAFYESGQVFYGLDKPVVNLKVFGSEVKPPYLCAREDSDKGWWRVHHPDFESIYWRNCAVSTYASYRNSGSDEPAQGTFCNGIWIPKRKASANKTFLSNNREVSFRFPQVSIFDRNGRLPINLNRSETNWDEASCTPVIARAVLQDVIEHMQINAIRPPRYSHPSFSGQMFPFVLCRDGVTFADSGLVEDLKISRILQLSGFGIAATSAALAALPSDCGIMITQYAPGSATEIVRFLRSEYAFNPKFLFPKKRTQREREFVISNGLVSLHAAANNVPEYQRRELSAARKLSDKYVHIEAPHHGDLRDFWTSLAHFAETDAQSNPQISELYVASAVATGHVDAEQSLMYTAWTEKFGGPLAHRVDVYDASHRIVGFRVGKGTLPA